VHTGASKGVASKGLTAAQVDAMIAMPKVVSTAPRLSPKSNAPWADARWPVHHELSPVSLQLLLHVQRGQLNVSKFSVSVLWNDVPVRRICVGFAHGGLDPHGCHLHKLDDRLGMDNAVELIDFPHEPDEGVLKACSLYGIDFKGTLAIPATTRQPHLFPE
jgi:hypothetical protein